LFEPFDKAGKPLVYIVDVEGCDFQRTILTTGTFITEAVENGVYSLNAPDFALAKVWFKLSQCMRVLQTVVARVQTHKAAIRAGNDRMGVQQHAQSPLIERLFRH
jgi:hypothetical protein